MSRIISIGNPFDIIPTTPLAISGLETVGEMDLKLALQGAELEHGLAERIAGIGSPRALGVGREVARYRKANFMLKRPDWSPRRKKSGLLQLAAEIDREHLAGIGFLKKLRKAVKNVASKAGQTVARAGRAVRQSNLIKKVAQGVKTAGRAVATGAKVVGKGALKAGKAFIKVATLPMRLFVKGLAELLLPKMSQLFLYLFITNPATIASLPALVQRKRRKAEKFARFMTNTIGMKEEHFLKIVRNGIIKNTKQTPEQLLARHVKGSLSGVGVLPLAVLAAKPLAVKLLPVVLEVIKKIAGLFGKKASPDETPTAADVPDESQDFDDAPTPVRRKVLTHLRHKPASQQGYQAAPPAEEIREQRQEETALEQVDQEPENTPLEAPLPDPAPVASDDEAVQAQPTYDGGENFDPEHTWQRDDYAAAAAAEEPQF